jgi:hypothetical protein
MHRTGTSLVAGLLHSHGLWLGEEADIMRADPYNPAGYFENRGLVEINDSILSLFGGSWSSPPDLPAAWLDDGRLENIRADARARAGTLEARGRPWGFKDPRAALTLPFWSSVCGELTVIVTLRNPLETARSLDRRDAVPVDKGIELWSKYYCSLLRYTTPESRIVVEYEALCADPVGSAGNLISRVPWLRQVDPQMALESVRVPLRHFRATLGDLQSQGAPAEVLELYAQLRQEAVNAIPEVGPDDPNEPILAALAGLDLAIRDVHFDLQRLTAVVTRLAGEVGFIRTADLTGIAALLNHHRGNELTGLPSDAERFEDAPVGRGRRD